MKILRMLKDLWIEVRVLVYVKILLVVAALMLLRIADPTAFDFAPARDEATARQP